MERERQTARLRRARAWLRRGGRSYVVVAVAALVVGALVAPVVWIGATRGATGTVAVIPVEGSIDGSSAAAYAATLDRARRDPSVDAAVLVVNSPGGTASASETMYLETARAAETMPVVTSVDAMAASGAYYTAAGSDYIFAKPSSLVGSVGVLFVPPPELEPTDQIITTGPNKLTGADERGWHYKTEALKRAFVGAVVRNRGENLTVPRSQVATAELFTGAEAVETGMADEIGGTDAAVRKAADMAGLRRYDVRVMRPSDRARFLTRTNYLASAAPNKTLVSATYLVGPRDGTRFPNYLMVPPGIVRAAMQDGNDTEVSDGPA